MFAETLMKPHPGMVKMWHSKVDSHHELFTVPTRNNLNLARTTRNTKDRQQRDASTINMSEKVTIVPSPQLTKSGAKLVELQVSGLPDSFLDGPACFVVNELILIILCGQIIAVLDHDGPIASVPSAISLFHI